MSFASWKLAPVNSSYKFNSRLGFSHEHLHCYSEDGLLVIGWQCSGDCLSVDCVPVNNTAFQRDFLLQVY